MIEPLQKHDADLAGGGKEVVYSSDGVETPALSFPVSTKSDEIDESELIPPEEAFQIFANKLFAPNPYSKKTVTDVVTQTNDSLLVRMGRLKHDIDEIKAECSTIHESPLLHEEILKLQKELQSLSKLQIEKQSGLSSSIQKSANILSTVYDTNGDPTGSKNNVEINSASNFEDRINRLEMVVGSEYITSDVHSSITSRVKSLESILLKLDDKKLDMLQKRGKVIRQDLEAAAKARNKLSSSVSASTSSSDDSKIISALYDGLQRLNGMSQHLPILASRLQALAHNHADSATRAARLKALELQTSDLSKQLLSVESAVELLDKSVKQNTSVMNENIKELEERMKGIH